MSATEDRRILRERVLGYLLKAEAKLMAKLLTKDDKEKRFWRNNIRKYKIPLAPFITSLLKTSMELQEDVKIKIERVHRATTPKPSLETTGDYISRIRRYILIRTTRQTCNEKKMKELNIRAQS